MQELVGQKRRQPLSFWWLVPVTGPQTKQDSRYIEFITLKPASSDCTLSHIQDSHGILSRFSLKEEERRAFLL